MAEDKSLERLITITELSDYLSVPVSWIYNHTRKESDEKLPTIRVGKYLRFNLGAVQGWLQRQGK